jgi:hypothetical protein
MGGWAELLAAIRENPASLVTDPTRDIRTFRVAAVTGLGTKRGRGRGCLIDSVLAAIDSFYAEVLQDLKAWSAAPPKLRPASPVCADEVEPTKPTSLGSTDYSSQDGPVDAGTAETAGQSEDPTGAGADEPAARGEADQDASGRQGEEVESAAVQVG